MSTYLDVISYLLTVLTFSVGFLSTRRHAHFDVLAKDLADRSWKIRQALNANQELGPRDIAEDVAAVSAEPDAVARFTRVVNAFFFISALVVFVLGLIAGPEVTSFTLLVILFASTVLVFALGEFDVRWMEMRERDLARGTVLGQLAAIDHALRTGDPSFAEDEIARIREAYPLWAFGRELALAVSAVGTAQDTETGGLDPIESLGDGSIFHVAPILVAEAGLRRDDPVSALQDFNIALPRSNASQVFDRLEIALELAAGVPQAVFRNHGAAAHWINEEAGLELGLRGLPAVRHAADALDDFGSGLPLTDWMRRYDGSPTCLVAQAAISAEDHIAEIFERASDSKFRGALNSMGIVALARGCDAEALRMFEAAIRVRPESSTSHWGRSIACARRGWQDAADVSLLRAASLDPSSARILSVTQAAFAGEEVEELVNMPGSTRWTAWEGIQLALLGSRPRHVEAVSGAREELFRAVFGSALERVEVIS